MTAAGRTRVAMLLGKSDEYDTRVRKEAEALAAAGFQVRVVSIAVGDGRPPVETVHGVTYERVGLRQSTRRAWQRRRARQERALQRRRERWALLAPHPERERQHPASTGNPTGAGHGRRRLVIAAARRLYRAKLQAERQAYLWLRAWTRHHEHWVSVAGPLARFEPHVVHSHDLLTLYAGRRYARRAGARLVYDSHELELHGRRYRAPHERLAARVVERAGVRAAEAVVTVSPDIAARLASEYRIRRMVLLLNSPPLGPSREPPPFGLRQACGVGAEDVVVVFTGALSRERGLEPTLAAFSHLPASHHFAIMGPREGHLEEAFRERVEAAGLSDRVHLVDPVPGELVSAVIADADAAVVPQESLYLSFDLALPNKLFEAVMAGLPIAASRARGISRFVERHELGALFDVRDPVSIARAIHDVTEREPPGIADRERLARLQEDVAWERQSEKLVDLYRDIEASVCPS